MRFGASAIAMVLFLSVLAFVPQVGADCPDPPKTCHSVVDKVEISLGDSRLETGVYEESDGELKQESASGSSEGILVLQEDGSFRPMAHDNGTRGELDSGEDGGVLVVVEQVGGAESFTLTFFETTGGIHWDSDGTITIPEPQDDGHYLIPFTVTSGGEDLEFAFDAEDDRDNAASGSFEVPVNGEDSDWWIYVLIAALAVLLVVFLLMRPKSPSGDEPPVDAGPTDADPPEPPVAQDPEEMEVVDVGVPAPADDLDDDGDDGETPEEEEPLTV